MSEQTNVKVGDRVRLLKASRHGMIPAGTVGTVVEIRTGGAASGISVEFMRAPSPQIARIFGKVPGVAEPFRCLYPAGCRLPFVVIGRLCRTLTGPEEGIDLATGEAF